ncbi:putative ribonuclease H-like domain-containing protein [Tanacetum coccineum]
MTEDEQVLHDELEKMIAQEVVAKALDDASRQAFEEEKRNITSQKRAAQATRTNKLSTVRSYVSTATTPYVSAASTLMGANAGESSFVYLRGQIPINASTLLNADLPTDPNMPDLEYVSNAFLNDGIFSGAYNDDDDVGAEANFNNMDNTIDVSPIPTLRVHKDYPKDQILGDPKSAVWVLVDLPYGKKVIGTKWVFKNKRDERSIVVKNKERLVAQGFRQEEGIDYDEVFAPVAWIEAIRLFLSFPSYMGFNVYQMDVKSAFLYDTIEEEVYVHQPLGFVDPAYPNKVYKVIKALYGLHQAPRAWYETLSSFLMENGFRRGTIDKTLFIKKKKSDIMLVQVYVDDIIFGSTKKSMCTEFEDCMHKRFQMSSMGELTFFLGLQVKQQPDGIFISQDKYVADILKKFDFWSIRTATTPIESNKPLVKDEDGEDVDVHVYRSMIGSLMYLTASRPDIMFAVCACARFQVTPKASHLNAVKRIFRYLKYQPKLGLWYPRDSPFELEAYLDSYYGGASLDRKSTTEYVAAANCSTIEERHDDLLESLERDIDGTEELLLPDLLILWLTKVSTDSAKLVPLGKDSTAIKPLEKIPPRTFLHEAPFTMLSLYITAKVAGKPVNISEASTRSDLLFDDADGIDSLHNQAIFNAIQLIGCSYGLQVKEQHNQPDPITHLLILYHPHPYHLFSHHLIHLINHHLIHLINQHLIHHLIHHLITHYLGPMKHLSLKLVTRIETLETELQQTKTTYGKAVLTLVKRRIWGDNSGYCDVSDSFLVRESMKMKEKSTDFVTPTKALGEAQEEDISPTILEAAKKHVKLCCFSGVAEEINTSREEINIGIEEVSTVSTKVDSGTASKRGQREGKAPMILLNEMVAKECRSGSNYHETTKENTKSSSNLKLNIILKKIGMILGAKTTSQERFLVELYRLVMQKYGTNRPEDAYDRVLWSDLRTMFDPPLNEDAI